MAKLLTLDQSTTNTGNPYRPLKNGETASLLTIDDVEKTADFTALANYSYSVNSTAGVIKVKLPSTAENGATITLQDTGAIAAVNNITIRNTADTSTWGVLDVNSGVITFVYNTIAGKWFVSYKTPIAIAAQYCKSVNNSQQSSITDNTRVLFPTNQSLIGDAISISSTPGIFILKAGNTYRVRVGVTYVIASLSPSIPAYVKYRIFNITSGTFIGNLAWTMSPNASTNDGVYMGPAEAVLKPTVDTQIDVKLFGISNVNYINNSDDTPSWIEIEVISTAPTVDMSGYVRKSAALVNAGVEVVLGNLRARIPTGGYRSLQIATVSGTYSVYGSCTFANAGNSGAAIVDASSPRSVTTTMTYLHSGLNFVNAGDTCTWLIVDISANISWRLSFIIGSGYNNNMISIEQLI